MRINETLELIKDAKKIAILPHISPDGDAWGSCIALAILCDRFNVKSFIIAEEEDKSPTYDFIKKYHREIIYSEYDINKYDLVIAVDCGDRYRMGKRLNIFEKAKNTINIDHHITNDEYADVNFVNTKSSSTAEIIYNIFKKIEIEISLDVATCIYVGMNTDTGGFRYSNTSSTTLRIAADLADVGVDIGVVNTAIYDNDTFSRINLMKEALNSLKLYHDGKTAVIILDDVEMKKLGVLDSDYNGIIELARGVSGVEVAVMIRKTVSGNCRVTLRAKSYADVAILAQSFGGGGHCRASGFSYKSYSEEFFKELLGKIEEIYN